MFLFPISPLISSRD